MSKFYQGRLVGSGTYARVYEGIEIETQKRVALKKIQLNEKEGVPSTALREISILKNLKHKNIIDLLQVIHTVDFLTMVMEFVDYDLSGYLDMNSTDGYFLINQLISGIDHLHKNKVVHRDLKPGNILVTKEGILKIADFGLARVISAMDSSYSPEVITLWYRPPELLEGATSYSFEVDIWSLGCIIAEIITRRPLLPGTDKNNQLSLCNEFNSIAYSNELIKHFGVPLFMIKIFQGCLHFNPNKRMGIEEIVIILEEAYSKL